MCYKLTQRICQCIDSDGLLMNHHDFMRKPAGGAAPHLDIRQQPTSLDALANGAKRDANAALDFSTADKNQPCTKVEIF